MKKMAPFFSSPQTAPLFSNHRTGTVFAVPNFCMKSGPLRILTPVAGCLSKFSYDGTAMHTDGVDCGPNVRYMDGQAAHPCNVFAAGPTPAIRMERLPIPTAGLGTGQILTTGMTTPIASILDFFLFPTRDIHHSRHEYDKATHRR